jgi:hypothetical protein
LGICPWKVGIVGLPGGEMGSMIGLHIPSRPVQRAVGTCTKHRTAGIMQTDESGLRWQPYAPIVHQIAIEAEKLFLRPSPCSSALVDY